MRRCTACWVLLLGVSFTAGRARAQQTTAELTEASVRERAAQSERLARRGFEQYNAGDYEEAIRLYKRALQAHAAAALYFNVARIYDKKLSAYDQALEYYRMALGAPDVVDALVDKSITRIRVLSALHKRPSSSPERVKPSSPQTRPVERQPSASRESSELPQPVAFDQMDADLGTEPRAFQATTGYAVSAVGLLVGTVSLGLGGWALVERNRAWETCRGDQCTTQEGVDAMNKAHDLARASTLGLVVGGAVAAAGLALVWFAPPGELGERDQTSALSPSGARSLGLAVVPRPGGANLQLVGTFF